MFEYTLVIYGLFLTLAWYGLRSGIDQHKGWWIEGLAIALPIALAALVLNHDVAKHATHVGRIGFRHFTTAIFLALPLMVVVRWWERLRQGEKLHLVDLFRLTTVIGLSLFAATPWESRGAVVLWTLCCVAIFLASSLVAEGQVALRPLTWLALAGSALIAAGLFLIGRLNLFFGLSSQDVTFSVIWVLLCLLAPWLWRGCTRSWLASSSLACQIEGLRLHASRLPRSISTRTLFPLWQFRPGVCYLNHGSFGAVPVQIQRAQRQWQEQCEAEPMDVLARRMEPAWQAARDRLAYWLGTPGDRLALCENATMAMNEIAAWFPLGAGDEVLLTNHEYGAVKRIWQRRADACGAILRYVQLPLPVEDPQVIVDTIVSATHERTRLVVVSHITSPTAIILPVAEICRALRTRDIASCIDGPHALLQERINLLQLDCDFYTASCHKWLCAPLGSGCLYVHPRWHARVQPARLSWGRLPPVQPLHWTDELTWVGTRDYSPYMAIPAAIDFFESFSYQQLDARNYQLACYARRVLSAAIGGQPVTPESRQWMGWMAPVWLPTGDHSSLQQRLWDRHGIEVPIVHFEGRYLVRVSCHLYNTTGDIDRLARALQCELKARESI